MRLDPDRIRGLKYAGIKAVAVDANEHGVTRIVLPSKTEILVGQRMKLRTFGKPAGLVVLVSGLTCVVLFLLAFWLVANRTTMNIVCFVLLMTLMRVAAYAKCAWEYKEYLKQLAT